MNPDAWGGTVVLVGMMGAGKSTVGPLLARRLGRAFVDADAEIEARTGTTIGALFAERGEAAFRRLEAETIAQVLGRGEAIVLATGGGAPLDPATQQRWKDEKCSVVWLSADVAVLAARIGDPAGRPMLGGDAVASLTKLSAARHSVYAAVSDHVVAAGDGLAEQIVERTAAALRGDRPGALVEVRVALGERSYPVLVGPGARAEVARLVPPSTRRVAVVTQAGIDVAVDPGCDHRCFVVGDGEGAKSLASVEGLCRSWADWGLHRGDAVLAVGGGVVTDLAGFAAAVYHRGLPVLHVPTTLLGQVDAAIGGKTGVNLPEGKNLIGAFWQPAGVVCDTDTLVTLPAREYRSGMGELAKYHFLGGGDLDRLALPDRVAAAVAIKAGVVSGDEREGGRRALLNYGHTLAHALEIAGRFDLRHGEAVAVGLRFAACLARVLGRIGDDGVAEHLRVLEVYGLGSELPAGIDRHELIRFMARDKKALSGLTFVLDGPDGVEVVADVDPGHVEAAFDAMPAGPQARS